MTVPYLSISTTTDIPQSKNEESSFGHCNLFKIDLSFILDQSLCQTSFSQRMSVTSKESPSTCTHTRVLPFPDYQERSGFSKKIKQTKQKTPEDF